MEYEKGLEPYVLVLSHLKDLVQEDVMVAITNRTHFVAYYPGDKIRLPVDVTGSSIPKGDHLLDVMRTNKIHSSIVPKEQFGFPFKSVEFPIKNKDGDVIGAIGIGKSMEKEFIASESAEILYKSIEEINGNLHGVASGSQTLANTVGGTVELARLSDDKIKEIDGIINVIRNISSQSNLLGLNASIEAAKAGDQGKGFSVVAGEMRKLSAKSSESANKISQTLTEVKKAVESVLIEINNINKITESQAAATAEIQRALETIKASARKLVENSRL